MPRKVIKNQKIKVMWICAALVVMTITAGAVALISSGNMPDFGASQPVAAESIASSTIPDAIDTSLGEEATAPASEKSALPSEMRAVTIKAGREFSLDSSVEEIKAQIDSAIDSAVSLKMNTVVLDPITADGYACYTSRFMPEKTCADGFNPIAYASERAKESGLTTSVVLHLTDGSIYGEATELETLDATLIDKVVANIDGFLTAYTPDIILLDGYYNPTQGNRYLTYLNSGYAGGYSSYLKTLPETLVNLANDKIETALPTANIGLLTEAVWANDYEDPNGSETLGLFSTLADGNADTLKFIDAGLCDFVAIKASGSTEDKNIPYQNVISWWDKQLSERGIGMYIVHSANKAVTEEAGWTEYDQLARQVIEGRKRESFTGSIFNSLSRLVENPKDTAGKLIGYYEGEVREEHILTDLEITQPKSNKFTSFSETVVFGGNTDPNTDATINDVAIKTDENGYFTLEMPLKEGKNTFTIKHKGKTEVYEITRVIEVVKEVTPTGVINADGATRMKITAVAYSEATVYAVINGTTVPMSIDEDASDESLKNTPYSQFSGSYTIPDATTAVQKLGKIVVYGKWNEHTKSKDGATVNINARALPSDGRPVVITSDYAETFPSDTLSHYSDPTYLPLPKGALDYAVGNEIRYTTTVDGEKRTYSYYRLASGLRVLSEDIATVSQANAPVGNRVTGATVKSDSRHTTITLATKQQVSFTARYSPEAVTVEFHFTDSLPESITLNKNPLFSSMEFKNGKMTLKLKQRGIFFGYHSSYDVNGNLVLRFNNPPSVSGTNLSGAKIALDPGHGGVDIGAPGYLASHPEKVINWSIATKVNSILQSRGAEVFMVPSKNYAYPLAERVAMIQDEDPHLLVSIHNNSHLYNRTAAGTEAYYFNPFSYALANSASSRVANSLSTTNRGAKFGYFAMTRSMQYPSILLEGGFMSNQTEYSKLVKDSYQNAMATAIADSISAYFKAMSVGTVLTGTQITGTMNKAVAPQSAAPASTTPASNTPAAEPEQSVLTLSEKSMKLSIGDHETLLATLEEGDAEDIVWSAEGDAAVKITKPGGEPDLIEIEAIKKGKVTILAKLSSDSSIVARCEIMVS